MALLKMGSVKNVGVADTPRISEPISFFEKTLFFGSVKNVGVADTPRISEPISFFEKTLFFIDSFGSIPQMVSCRTSLFFSIGFSGHQGTKR
ncbi:MAG: hypothetical protein MRZ82_05660 [Firmicutes bacterium]|nr:hypothetical protein [Bacillota bacterium]